MAITVLNLGTVMAFVLDLNFNWSSSFLWLQFEIVRCSLPLKPLLLMTQIFHCHIPNAANSSTFGLLTNTCFSNNLINVDHMTMIKVIPDLPNLQVVQRSSFSMNDFEMIFTKEMAGTAIETSSTYCLVAYDAPPRNRQCLPWYWNCD